MKILITGGLGYLGSWLTDFFCRKNNEVYVLSVSDKRPLDDVRYHFIQADITDADDLKAKITGCFDYCIHAASANDHFIKDYPPKALLVNGLGTRNILEALVDKEIKRFLYFSTFHVYGKDSGDVDENTPVNPKSDYALTHLFGEYYVKQFWHTHRIPYTILRPTNCYGAPKQFNSTKWYLVINDLARTALEKGKIVLTSNGQAVRDFIWLGDVCDVVNNILETDKTAGETFNVSSGRKYSVIDIAEMIKRVYEKRYKKTISIRPNEIDKSAYRDDLHVNNSKLKSFVNVKIHDRISEEITNIFDLLEKHSSKQ